MKKLKCILLVDDDPIVIFVNSSLIDRLEVTDTILTAGNGQEALALLTSRCTNGPPSRDLLPELILLDISMPVMNGFEFLEAFEQLDLHPRPSVVLLTNSMSPKDQLRATQFNLTAMLNKPLTPDVLNSLVEKYFSQQEHV